MTIKEIFLKYGNKLSPLDMEIILSYGLNKPKEFLYTHDEYKISEKKLSAINNLILRRLQSEPIAYITGRKEFFGIGFDVNKNVLIPRPETELLVENALNILNTIDKEDKPIFIDIGTGSGNIILSVYKNLLGKITKNIHFIALDKSTKALDVAKHNAKKLAIEGNVRFINSNLLSRILKNKRVLTSKRIIIAANLPYLTSKEYRNCAADVKQYEPKIALKSSSSGLNHYHRLLSEIKKLINLKRKKTNICLFLEISPSQKNNLKKIVLENFPKSKIKYFKDLSSKIRLVKIDIII
jgi:release factor glutamine methyltransferase